jgi:3'-phosphoadenosine 5'-phosphosulfate sulfotransferase (PAPS reductase)/FAD synthetase
MTHIATLEEALSDTTARHVVSFSGGKDSTALAVYLLEHYPGYPFEFVFCDTGAELPETYDYIRRFESIFGVTVTQLTALEMLGIRDKSGRKSFDVILNEYYGGFLPSPQARWCTRMLKIKPFEHYLGNTKSYSYIAIRADEKRLGYQAGKKPVMLSEQPNIIPVYPFKDLGLGYEDVRAVLDNSGLGFPSYYEWRSRSGCYFCFYQQIGEWQGLLERHPELFEQAKGYEKVENGKSYTWTDRRSLKDIEALEERYEVPRGEGLEGCAICHL